MIFAAALALALAGCSDWLSIEPKSEISAERLLRTPEGFSTAMNGIYTNLSSGELYANYLKFSMVEVMARNYKLGNSAFNSLEFYDYESCRSYFQQTWATAYNVIANCNILLEEMDKKDESFFEVHERNMLKGELLSIRAMLYLDLLRLFAPAPAVGDEAAIPYYDKLTITPVSVKSKTSVILAAILRDLETSKQLQREFDTSASARNLYTASNRFRYSSDFFGNGRRGMRMGYYATTALLARAALYAGDTGLAYDNARELIDDEILEFTSGDKILAGTYDRLFSDDLLFGLYREEFEESFNKVVYEIKNVDKIYGNDFNDDFRAKWLAANNQLNKYDLSDNTTLEGSITSVIPMIRLSEMYHIAVEAIYDTDPDEAVRLFNELRTSRGCRIALAAASKSELLDLLVNDARREYISEGQMFFMYKRLNRKVLDETDGNQTLTDEFIVPVPLRETTSNAN